MSTLLCVIAHPLDATKSASVAAASEFLSSYRDAHPSDEVLYLDLYRMDIPLLDKDVFSGWEKLNSGCSLDQLSSEERRKVVQLQALVDQFVTADKYVFVTPLWNFSYPPLMKAYIDAVSVPGKTFKYTSHGPVGLLKDKKGLHIQARGSVYTDTPRASLESGHSHLDKVLQFLGFPALEGLFIEGLEQFHDRAQAMKEEAFAKARVLARTF